MKRMHLVTVVVLILITLIFAYSQSPLPSPQREQTATQIGQRKPEKAKKVLVKELPKTLEGIVLENGHFKLKPGYKFLPQPNGTVTVGLQAGGGGVSGSFDCFCSKEGGGSCSATTVGGTISCSKSKTTPCSDECILRTTIGGNRTRLAIF